MWSFAGRDSTKVSHKCAKLLIAQKIIVPTF